MIDGQHVLVFTCHPQEMTDERDARSGDYCTWSVPGDSAARAVGHRRGPAVHSPSPTCSRLRWCSDATAAGRSSASATSSPRASLAFEILDPIPVVLVDGYLQADPSYVAPPAPEA